VNSSIIFLNKIMLKGDIKGIGIDVLSDFVQNSVEILV